jgi:hypothetical protein
MEAAAGGVGVIEQESVAKRILRGESFTRPAAPSRADELIALATRSTTQFDAWHALIEQADTHTLIATIGAIGRGDEPLGSRGAGYREAARAMLDQKLTDRMIEKMEKLDTASTRLGRIGIGLAVVGLIEAIVIAWAST